MEKTKRTQRISYSKIPRILDYPNLMDVQVKFFRNFLQEEGAPSERTSEGLQAVFENVFPITDSRGNYELQFVEYYLDKPKYNVRECQERGVTYAVPLRYMLVVIRGIILKGVGIQSLMPEVIAMSIFGTVIMLLAAMRFRKRLD